MGLKRLCDPIQPICGVEWEQMNTGDGMFFYSQLIASMKSICDESMDIFYIVDERSIHYAKKPDTKRSHVV